MRFTRFLAVGLAAACLLLCLFGLAAPASAQCPGGSCAISGPAGFAALPPVFDQAPMPPALAPLASPASSCQPGQACSVSYSYAASSSAVPIAASMPVYVAAPPPVYVAARAAPIAGIPIAVGRAVTWPFRAFRFGGGGGFGCRSCR